MTKRSTKLMNTICAYLTNRGSKSHSVPFYILPIYILLFAINLLLFVIYYNFRIARYTEKQCKLLHFSVCVSQCSLSFLLHSLLFIPHPVVHLHLSAF